MESFGLLSARRPIGMALGAIPFTDIKAYLEFFPWHDYEEFILYITRMDSKYLEIQNKKSDSKNNKTPSNNGSPITDSMQQMLDKLAQNKTSE